MDNMDILITIGKVIMILLILAVFNFIIYQYLSIDKKAATTAVVEKFNQNTGIVDYNNPAKYKPYNIRMMYENTGEYPWNRHSINSSIPYDVNIKKEAANVYYYEFDNTTFNDKLKEIFESKCEELIIAVEGSKWNSWKNPKTLRDTAEKNKLKSYYDTVFNFILKKLQCPIMDLPSEDKKQKMQVVHDIMLRYRTHSIYTSYYMFDMDMILYRAGKFQGKHVKLVVITNGSIINVILAKIVGVVSEDNIVIYPYTSFDKLNTNTYQQFIPSQYGTVESDTKNSSENTFNVSDSYMNSEIEAIMYKKLLEENIPEDVDISNNNFTPNAEELVKKDKCLL
uniref:Uncharacterized protein n=1 Tax=viral metagenome TaxID=1070528 RepID=A0A6C0LEE0_9ZZZZ